MTAHLFGYYHFYISVVFPLNYTKYEHTKDWKKEVMLTFSDT